MPRGAPFLTQVSATVLLPSCTAAGLEDQFQRVLQLSLVVRGTCVGAEARRGKRIDEPGEIGMIKSA